MINLWRFALIFSVFLIIINVSQSALADIRYTAPWANGQYSSPMSACTAAINNHPNNCIEPTLSGTTGMLCTGKYAVNGAAGCYSHGVTEVAHTDCSGSTPVWSEEFQECVPPDGPLNENCDQLSTSADDHPFPDTGEIQFVPFDSDEITSFCTPYYERDDKPCTNVLGYFNGNQVCGDDKDSCETGELGGFYGFTSPNLGGYGDGQAICIPQAYADDVPTCDISTVNVLELEGSNGGFACAGPIEDPMPDDPQAGDPEPDTDGDGIPDSNDPDIDGDGIPNSQDPDKDGDGIPDEDDPTPQGEGPQNSVDGGGTCSTRPSCTGDAVQCAILFQLWSARCEAEKREKGDDGETSDIEGFDPNNAALTQPGDGDIPTTETDASGLFGQIFSVAQQSGTCPADAQITLATVGVVTVPYTFLCQFASTIRPLVLLLMGFVGFRIGLRGFE